MAWEYGATIGMPVSEVLKLPVDEYVSGFLAYKNVKKRLVEAYGD